MSIDAAFTVLLGALLSIIVGFVAGFRLAANKAEETKENLLNRFTNLISDLNSIKSAQNSHEKEMTLRVVILEKDLEGIKESNVNFITAIELERRIEAMLIRKDELRRRIIRIERSLFKDDLDGADSSMSTVTVIRPQGKLNNE